MDAGTVVVKLVADTNNLVSGLASGGAATEGFAAKVSAVSATMQRTGLAMTKYITLPAAALGIAAVKAASDLEESMNKVNVVFGQSATAVQAWSQTTSSGIGQSRAQALEAAGTFGNLFSTMGMGSKEAATMSMELVELASDLASFNNIDPTEALEKLRSGLVGEVEPLRSVGVLLSEAAVRQEAYRLGLAEAGAELTEQQKVQARYSLILQQTQNAQGDFSRTSDSLANTLRTLKAQVVDIAAKMGTLLLPFVQQLAGAVSGVMDRVNDLSPGWQKVVVAFVAAAAAAGPLLLVLGKVVSVIGLIAGIAGGGWIAAIVAGIVAIAAALGTLYAKSETFRTIVNTVWGEFMSTVQAVVAAVLPLLRQLWDSIVEGVTWLRENVDWAALWADLQPALQAAAELLTTFITTFITGIGEIVSFIREHWSTIGPIVEASLTIAVTAVQTFFRVVTPLIHAVNALLHGDWSTAWEKAREAVAKMAEGVGTIMQALAGLIGRLALAAMKALWEAFKDGVEKAVEFVKSLPGKAADALASLAGKLKTAGVQGMTGLWNGLKDKWSDVIAWVQTIPTKVGNAFSGAAQWLWSEGYSIISGLLNGIKAAWEAVAGYLSTLGGKIKELKGPLEKDRALLVPEGRAIMEGLAAGIEAGATGVFGLMAGIGPRLTVGTAAPAVATASGASPAAALGHPVINVDARGSTNPAAVEAAARRGAIIGYAEAHRQLRIGTGRS